MVTFWKCGACGRVFKVNSQIKKYLDQNHEDPICPCGCKVVKQVTKFHYDNFIADRNKKVRQSKFSLTPGLADDPRFAFLAEPIDVIWRDRGDDSGGVMISVFF